MKKSIGILLVFLAVLFGFFLIFSDQELGKIISQSNKTPDCGDERTLNLVKEIAQGELDEQHEIAEGSLALTYVATTAYDKEIDAYSCSATLEAKYKKYGYIDPSVSLHDLSRQITFNVYPLATDQTQFMVSVSGL